MLGTLDPFCRPTRRPVGRVRRTGHSAPDPRRCGTLCEDTTLSGAALQASAQDHAGGDWLSDHGDLGEMDHRAATRWCARLRPFSRSGSRRWGGRAHDGPMGHPRPHHPAAPGTPPAPLDGPASAHDRPTDIVPSCRSPRRSSGPNGASSLALIRNMLGGDQRATSIGHHSKNLSDPFSPGCPNRRGRSAQKPLRLLHMLTAIDRSGRLPAFPVCCTKISPKTLTSWTRSGDAAIRRRLRLTGQQR